MTVYTSQSNLEPSEKLLIPEILALKEAEAGELAWFQGQPELYIELQAHLGLE